MCHHVVVCWQFPSCFCFLKEKNCKHNKKINSESFIINQWRWLPKVVVSRIFSTHRLLWTTIQLALILGDWAIVSGCRHLPNSPVPVCSVFHRRVGLIHRGILLLLLGRWNAVSSHIIMIFLRYIYTQKFVNNFLIKELIIMINVLQSMFVMKHNEMLTDVRLEVVHEVFHAHKIILAAASPYFKGTNSIIWLGWKMLTHISSWFSAMFTSGLREKDASVVKLQGICPTVMGKLLNFIYTGEIVINQLVVCQLLPAASMLQV